MNAYTNIEMSAVATSEVDVLGALLAQIEDLTAQAEAIKNRIKEDGADGKLAVEVVKGKEIKYVNGALFRATYSESNVTSFDKDAFIKVHGAEAYAKYTKTSARFTVKVTSK
jgi:hypothetical protein